MELNEVEEIFLGMGYEIADGPEVEKAIYNFLNTNLETNVKIPNIEYKL